MERLRIALVDKAYYNIGLSILHTLVRNEGYEVGYFHEYVEKDWVGDGVPEVEIERTFRRVMAYRPDVVGFSAFSDNFRYLSAVAQRIKAADPQVTTVFGGVHATLAPQVVASKGHVDYIVVGEGEEAFIEFLRRRQAGLPVDDIQNLGYRQNGGVQINSIRPYIDVNSIPYPDVSVFSGNPRIPDMFPIITGRGCPFSCTYCSNNAYHKLYCSERKHVRRKSVDYVIGELKSVLERFDVNCFLFTDDVFTIDRKWLAEFAARYSQEIGIKYRCINHPNHINEDVARLLKESGCVYVQLGFQTANAELRRHVLDRNETNERIAQGVVILQRHGLPIAVDHILGIPTETAETIEESALFYSHLGVDYVAVYGLTYYPGTDIIQHGGLDDVQVGLIGEGMFQGAMTAGGSLGHTVGLDYFTMYQRLLLLVTLVPTRVLSFLIRTRVYRGRLWQPVLEVAFRLLSVWAKTRRYGLRRIARNRLRKLRRRLRPADVRGADDGALGPRMAGS